MLNSGSRKYFNRVYASSGSAFSAYALRKANHLRLIQECFKIKEMSSLVDYLKTANASTLNQCYRLEFPGEMLPTWVPTIERVGTKGAFFEKTPDEIYSSSEAPIMDTMFSFTSQVLRVDAKMVISKKSVIFYPISFLSRKYYHFSRK